MYEVHVLFVGYCRPTNDGMLANCTCTLVKGPKNIIVDTMTPWDKAALVEAIHDHGLEVDDIDYVVSTHGHSDHIGNNNLFLKAQHLVGRCVSYKHIYYDDSKFFNSDGVYEIDNCIQIVSTPGHTLVDVSVIVQTTQESFGIVGDLFENEDDLMDESIWLNAGSENPDSQRKNRKMIMEKVDWIIPGHGPMFSTNKYK
ncbi:metallo-beta-lactamase domain-containing protein 1 [Sipha flava]|jgi:glyoxylase-like metal-dependent hydrolase (beta-lactamase superfamily II)|uniref:Metallo-beta-lactamase domain-containing protein 1 n=1 Tax=Sipha flava TaxID=143950 RepID=A0A8B8GNR5_9HEMI|nr:metallo-beta-lactamase domain-containing protein 1 [Sipha flava]